MSMEDLPEDLKDIIRKKIEEHPELVEKYGDPFDSTDPRYWRPASRKDKGVSSEDRLSLLENDVELLSETLGKAMMRIAELSALVEKLEERQVKRLIEEAKDNPEKAAELMDELLQRLTGNSRGVVGSLGPDGDSGPAYAGSTQGIPPDTLVETPNGRIRADEIPGYVNSPDWHPSPDWVQANCTCPAHVAEREAAAQMNPFGINLNDEDPPNGMYL